MSANVVNAIAMVDEAYREYGRSLFVQSGQGRSLCEIPHISYEEAARRTALGGRLLASVAAIDVPALPASLRLAVQVAQRLADGWSREAEWYWLVFNTRGMGYFGMFTAAPYGGVSLLTMIHDALGRYAFADAGDLDRYLGLISDYARLVRQMHQRTTGQIERGIAMPRSQVLQASALLRGIREQARLRLAVAPERLTHRHAGDAITKIADRIEDAVLPAFDAFVTDLEGSFLAVAGDVVGLGQYPGGAAVYGELVRLNTTFDIAPADVHAIGVERIAEIRAEMAAVARDAGFAGNVADYRRALTDDPTWRAETPEAVGALFQQYIDRLEPEISRYFHSTPATAHGVRPLASAMEGAMTFGFYRRPTPEDPEGVYFFNARNLTRKPLMTLAALTYHELEPGHHMQMAGLQESRDVHALVAESFVNAYAEGWAEYGAAFAGEIGMYRSSGERFGKLMMEAFLTCRLVVDTGMNALGWSLEQAREYLRENAFISEAEVLTESIRYSCDIPGQSLAYKLGEVKLVQIREEMRAALGTAFDVRDFHQVVLDGGSLPLSLVESRVRERTRELRDLAA